jgi:ABC-type dipeptide/oligopeptide/nickel transport system ATPase subunit
MARQVAELRQKLSYLSSLDERIAQKRREIDAVQQVRLGHLDELDAVRESRFTARSEVASYLNKTLGPTIRVDVERSGEFREYANAIASALRGSQIHYNTVAPVIARSMSPRELVEAVEQNEAATISELANLDDERAQRIISYLSVRGTQAILTAPVEDVTHFSLLDGGSYRRSTELSTGQRCTVVLSILLQHRNRVLVVDEPENHLDNAFIVKTLVQSLRQRAGESQLIFSTHNPNIPVLGEAASVVVLSSDGRTGYVQSAEPLEASASVHAITDLMEGGLEAFRRRAAFYESSAPEDG